MALKDRVLKMEESVASENELKESIRIIEKLCDELIKKVENSVKDGYFNRWNEGVLFLHTYCCYDVVIEFKISSGYSPINYQIYQHKWTNHSCNSTDVEININRKLISYMNTYVKMVTDYLKKEGFKIVDKNCDNFKDRISIEFSLKWKEK